MTIYRGPGGTGEARTDSDVTEVRIIADEAEGYKDQAATSASAAASSASAAATAETNAETAEANAETAEANAEAAQAAAEAAQAAAEAAQTAAEAAQTAAELAETNAETAEANAETAEANAETAQAAAATSATNAAASASTATTQASNAASSASTATTQAGIATTKASEAASSATAAQSAQTAAESARDSALSAYDNFDDRYLGPKASDPTLDNDGNALLTGALYYDTTSSVMKVYTGSSWVAAYVSAAGTLLAANNLSDLVSVSTARTNLGLGTAALVADSTLVHKTGDETIAGTKTFSSTITGSISGNAATATTATNVSGGTASVTTLTTSSTVTHNGGTANGVPYLNGSKVLTTGSALTFDGTNLGVGTSSPGSYYAKNLVVGVADQGGITIASSPTAVETYLAFADGTSGADAYTGYIGYSHTSNFMRFATNSGGERMRIDSSGDLGLGVTPSAWTSIDKAFEIGRAGNGLFSGGVDDVTVNSNAYYASGWKYGSTGFANRFNIGSGNGSFQWFTAASGTAGNAISFTQAMTLDASGSLGIGTTSMLQKVNSEGSIGTRNGGHTLTTASYTNAGGLYLDSSGSKAISLRADPDNDASGTYIGFATDGTERARIDSSGNVGIGTSSPAAKLEVAGTTVDTEARVNATTARAAFRLSNTGGVFGLYIDDSTGSSFGGGAYTRNIYSNQAYPLRFWTNDAERARIDSSGNLLVGTTSQVEGSKLSVSGSNCFGAQITGVNGGALNVNYTAGSGTAYYGYWKYGGGVVGYITSTGSTVNYTSVSDYRLKEDIQPMAGALAKVAALKPCTYKWKADGSDGQGFIAHELAEVVPQCVTGEKDAVDAEGNPQYQGIDTSFLVATLTAAIQEQQAIILAQQTALTALTARVEALESN